jgi:chemotaxis signal transduction protein
MTRLMNDRPNFINTNASTDRRANSTRFLEQLSDEAFWQLAAQAARPLVEPLDGASTHAAPDEALICVLAHDRCMLPLVFLREVVPPPYHFSSFPSAPAWMVGVCAWRGEIIAVADLDAYLMNSTTGVPAGRVEARHGILLVIQHDGFSLGWFVSTVESTVALNSEVQALMLDIPQILHDMVQQVKA